MPISLDALQPDQVTGHTVLKADLGVGGRELWVISGFAMPGWKIDSDSTHRDVCRVRLRVPGGTVEQSTVHVGLASIANDDTEYVFATDDAKVEVDEAGELVLVAHLAVMGEPSVLNRFSYQVVVTSRVVISEISGTISWPTAWLRPTLAGPAGVSGVFTVRANDRRVTPSQGGFGGEIEHLTPVAAGEIVSVTIGDEECRATYRIAEPPRGRQLKVTVEQRGLRPPAGLNVEVGPVVMPNGDLVTLTVAEPTRAGVDFKASAMKVL
jgi:hypothetical protein